MQLLGIEDEADPVMPAESIMPVPFDFDFSGLVNATYAAPPSQIPIRDVRFRYFYGLCVPRPILDEAIVEMQSKREEILSLVAGTEQLEEGLREKNLAYIEEFFEIIDDPKKTNEEIVRRCRGVDLMNKHFSDAATGSTSDP
jgi:hypothetical protein